MIAGMPNIPNFAGLVTSAEDAAISLAGAALIRAVFGNVWSVVNQYGVPVVLKDSFYSMDYTNTQETSKDPIENGKVMTYNKVNNPRKCNVVLIKSTGGQLERGAFMAEIEIMANSTLKYHIITPDYVHTNMLVMGWNYGRSSSNGCQMISASIDFEEAKIAKVAYEQEEVKNAEDSKTVDSGKVQATENQSALSKIGDGVVSGISKLFGN